MDHSDVAKVVEVHLASFPGFFLSQLGPKFLGCLYDGILDDHSGIALVYKQNQDVLGFVAGTCEPRGFYGRLVSRRWHRFALASVGTLVRDPRILSRLLNAFRKSIGESNDEHCGLLMSIAVVPFAQASGIGSTLVGEFLNQCRESGLTSVHLTTDHSANEVANRFYTKLGFKVSRLFKTPHGRVMNDFRIDFDLPRRTSPGVGLIEPAAIGVQELSQPPF